MPGLTCGNVFTWNVQMLGSSKNEYFMKIHKFPVNQDVLMCGCYVIVPLCAMWWPTGKSTHLVIFIFGLFLRCLDEFRVRKFEILEIEIQKIKIEMFEIPSSFQNMEVRSRGIRYREIQNFEDQKFVHRIPERRWVYFSAGNCIPKVNACVWMWAKTFACVRALQ